ncbi:HAD family hydrolase [Enemella sp. A6]|uniref:HAD family hydrolase n=1 Tax=Enemella sp. A6 TaxID=3440152 RepID=UPI003EC07CAA
MSYRNVVWDMGGTLLDTYPEIDALFAERVAATGARVDVSEVARLTRLSTSRAMSTLAERFDVTVDELTRAYADLKQRWRSDPPPVMPGAREVIDAVRAHGGLNLIVTHRDRESATHLLEATGLVVDDMVCAPDGHRRKPDPQMYRLMAERHGLEPSSCLGVGDRAIDAAGARAAGMATCFLTTAGLPLPNELASDHVTDQLVEVLPLLG